MFSTPASRQLLVGVQKPWLSGFCVGLAKTDGGGVKCNAVTPATTDDAVELAASTVM